MDTKELNRKIADAISETLAKRGKPATWLATASGIPYSTLKRILSGNAPITTDKIGAIAHALNVPASKILPREIGGGIAGSSQ